MTKSVHYALSLGILLLASAQTKAQEYWRLPAEQARCVLSNISAYLEVGTEVIMIVAAGCPEPNPGKALATVTRNSAVPSLQTLPDDAEIDSIVVYRPKELVCLGQLEIDVSGQITLLPKEPKC